MLQGGAGQSVLLFGIGVCMKGAGRGREVFLMAIKRRQNGGPEGRPPRKRALNNGPQTHTLRAHAP